MDIYTIYQCGTVACHAVCVCVLYMHFSEYIIYMIYIYINQTSLLPPYQTETHCICYCVCVGVRECVCVWRCWLCVCVKTFFEVKFNLHKTDKK